MAEVVAQMPGKNNGRNSWLRYADGRIYKLKAGEDFVGDVASARTNFAASVYHRGKRAITRTSKDEPGVLYLQAVPRTGA